MILKPSTSTVLSDPKHRYALAASGLSTGMNILDVGGYNDRRALIASILGNDFGYVAVNDSAAWYGDAKSEIYDGHTLPYEDKVFDAAISIDTLEHIDRQHRAHFISEMIRVSKKVIVVAPFSDPSRPTLEPLFAKISKLLNVEVKPAAMEHIEKGLPTLDDIRTYFADQNYNIEFGTDYAKFWQMIFLQLIVNAIGRGKSRRTNELLQRIFEKRLKGSKPRDRGNSYRVMVST